jgi:hypothetical protein
MACGSATLVSRDGGAGSSGSAINTGGTAGAARARGEAGATGAGSAAGAAGATGAAGAGGTAGKATDGGGDLCEASGIGALGVLGCPCSSSGKLACNGNAQAVALICSQGIWTVNQTCEGSNFCRQIDPLCEDAASAGRNVCATPTSVAQCGPDRVSHAPGQTCSGATPTCLDGACVACAPSSTAPCGPCSDGTQTCGADGSWGACMGASSTRTYYRDADGDGYGDPFSPKVVCGTAPVGYVADSTDCCDKDTNAHPGQASFFTAPDACGSSQSPDGFDYNCDGKDDLQNANLNTLCQSSGPCGSADPLIQEYFASAGREAVGSIPPPRNR